MRSSATSGTAMRDANTDARRIWLGSLQGKHRIGENLKTALALVALLACYSIVGRIDYEEELMQQAEQNSYVMAGCSNGENQK